MKQGGLYGKKCIVNSGGISNLICLSYIVSMFNKLPVNEVHFVIAHYCIVVILKTEKKHTVDILYVNVKFQVFYFLCCKGVVSRERANETLSSVARELLVLLLILNFYNVFK